MSVFFSKELYGCENALVHTNQTIISRIVNIMSQIEAHGSKAKELLDNLEDIKLTLEGRRVTEGANVCNEEHQSYNLKIADQLSNIENNPERLGEEQFYEEILEELPYVTTVTESLYCLNVK